MFKKEECGLKRLNILKVQRNILTRKINLVYLKILYLNRIDHPRNDYAEKDMMEIYPIQLQENDNSDEWVKYVFNLSALSIQYDQKTTLPLPLHLAKTLAEDYLLKL